MLLVVGVYEGTSESAVGVESKVWAITLRRKSGDSAEDMLSAPTHLVDSLTTQVEFPKILPG